MLYFDILPPGAPILYGLTGRKKTIVDESLMKGKTKMASPITSWKDKALFTPGPLTTSRTVKQAMLRDLGSRDLEFIQTVRDVRRRLLRIGQVHEETYTAIIMQGSGTFGIESVISSVVPPDGKLLVLVNGAYGERMVKMAQVYQIPLAIQQCLENSLPDLNEIDRILSEDVQITHVAVVHCETTTGILNPIREISAVVKKHACAYIVDAMSSFGAYPIIVEGSGIDFLISSSNKCIEGIPGFSFILAKRSDLEKCKNQARTLSLDLFGQWVGLNSNGQFRFTPPVQVLLAFKEALNELEKEGGISARASRYAKNNSLLITGMKKLGFKQYLPDNLRGYIITSFLYPSDPNFSFEMFYSKLNDKGFVIYPGKLSKVDCFRIGNIGHLFNNDIQMLVDAIEAVLYELKIELKKG